MLRLYFRRSSMRALFASWISCTVWLSIQFLWLTSLATLFCAAWASYFYSGVGQWSSCFSTGRNREGFPVKLTCISESDKDL